MRAKFLVKLAAISVVAAGSTAEAGNVDVAIVFAVDVSASVGPAAAYMQREGHAEALSSPETMAAIEINPIGCIAVTYFEWSGPGELRTIVPWSTICNAGDAKPIASAIRRHGYQGMGCEQKCSTSISFALDAARIILDRYTGTAPRKVIDISANGTNNDGLSVEVSRQEVVDQGHTINAIAIPERTYGVKEDLFGYFAEKVIGGPGAFVIEPTGLEDYGTALRRKLVLEIADAHDAMGEARLSYRLRRGGVGRRQTYSRTPMLVAKARYRPVTPRNRARG
ncbi:MAG: hypothetical protein BGO03_05290 [Mesorhizobium sp. 61-13]|nr:MAG: hypothetical protein BGO03_05290 [Mesorhizobium sp. 61-13]